MYNNHNHFVFDVLVKNQHSKIETDIFYKEQTASCIFYSTRVTLGILNLACRLRTIVSEEHNVLTRTKELKSFLIKQNYPLQTIEYGINRAMALDKHILRTLKEKSEGNYSIRFNTQPERPRNVSSHTR